MLKKRLIFQEMKVSGSMLKNPLIFQEEVLKSEKQTKNL